MRSSLSVFMIAVTAITVACSAGDSDQRAYDTAGGAIVDSAPAQTAAAAFTLLADENIFALLDTAYVVMAQLDQLAATKATDTRVREFAASAVNANTLSRRAVATTAEQLKVAPVLPDEDAVEDGLEALTELRTKSGRDFDAVYVREAAELREEMADEIEDALESDRRAAEVRTLLGQLKQTLDAERKALGGLNTASR
jgi:predicted outer membrane protein